MLFLPQNLVTCYLQPTLWLQGIYVVFKYSIITHNLLPKITQIKCSWTLRANVFRPNGNWLKLLLALAKKKDKFKEEEAQLKLMQSTICSASYMNCIKWKGARRCWCSSTYTSLCFVIVVVVVVFRQCNCCCSPVAKFMFTVALIKFNMHIAKPFQVGQTVRSSVRPSCPLACQAFTCSLPPCLLQELVVGPSTMCVSVCVGNKFD